MSLWWNVPETFFFLISGETSSGKSSIINLILGENILPTGIRASTSRVCRVKHSDCYEVSTKDRNGEILEEKQSFKNAKEMAEKLQDLAGTADEEIGYVDIYMPVLMLQVDTINIFNLIVNYNHNINIKWVHTVLPSGIIKKIKMYLYYLTNQMCCV